MYWVEAITPKFSVVAKEVAELERRCDGVATIKIAFLRNITLDTVGTYLKYYCAREKIYPSVDVGEYDNIMPTVMSQDSAIYRFDPDMLVLALSWELLSEKLAYEFASMTHDQIHSEEENIFKFIFGVLENLRRHTQAFILVNNFERLAVPAFGVLDHHKGEMGQAGTIRRLNKRLMELVSSIPDAYVVDIDLLQSCGGRKYFKDNRFWHIARSPYSRSASQAIAWEYMKYIRALKGRAKKCLVLDCDQTMWGGILGEDGLANIRIGHSYPGSAYRDFQKAILNLWHRGIILAIVSRNNESDVLEVLQNHPDMVLRAEHFASMRINWSDKATNIREIAGELNIGLESMVFLDDSSFEINMIQQLLPEVTALQLPNDPADYHDLLASCGLFDSLIFSEEDRNRGQLYKAQVERKKAQTAFSGECLDDYLAFLEMEVIIRTADDFAVPRISQLTQRTNQFNLTTRRYSSDEVAEMTKDPGKDVLYLQVKDRFGDNGIVGVAILEYQDSNCLIESFLLSCRVLGRGVEDVFLAECAKLALAKGCSNLIGFYLPTSKNSQAADFFPSRGFLAVPDEKTATTFKLDLGHPREYPNYYTVIVET